MAMAQHDVDSSLDEPLVLECSTEGCSSAATATQVPRAIEMLYYWGWRWDESCTSCPNCDAMLDLTQNVAPCVCGHAVNEHDFSATFSPEKAVVSNPCRKCDCQWEEDQR